jgi:hypothetical protein
MRLRLLGTHSTVTGNRSPFNPGRKTEYAGLILGILMFGVAGRKSLMGKKAKLFAVVLLVSAVASVLSGCVGSYMLPSTIYVEATPAGGLAPVSATQTVVFLAYYN